MYLQKVISKKNLKPKKCWRFEGREKQNPEPELDLDSLVRGADPDLYQNVTDLEHWETALFLSMFLYLPFSISWDSFPTWRNYP
jgi:hypothetical protein